MAKAKTPNPKLHGSDAEVLAIISARCAVCHSAAPARPGWVAPPKGIVYDSINAIRAQVGSIYQQSVATKIIAIGNLESITDDEQAKAWAVGRRAAISIKFHTHQ